MQYLVGYTSGLADGFSAASDRKSEGIVVMGHSL
jgi:hypothetical protein